MGRVEAHRMSSRQVSDTGFTLVEVLLALLMFAMIAGVIFASFAAVTRGVEKGRQSMDIYRVGRTALQRMAQEISAAVQFPGDIKTALLGEDNSHDDQARDRITFTLIPYRRFSTETPGSDLCDVSYYIDTNAEEKDALFRDQDCTPGAERQDDSEHIALTELAAGLDITYYDATDEHDEWPPGGGTALVPLPCFIRIALTLRDEQKYERTFITTVALPMRGGCEDEQQSR